MDRDQIQAILQRGRAERAAGSRQRLNEFNIRKEREAEAASRQPGIVEQLASSIISPVTDFTAGLGAQARQQSMLRSGIDASNFRPTLVSEEEFERFVQDPLGENLKRAAGAASLFVPGAGTFGGGVRGLAKSGVLSGVLSGFGASEAGQELTGAATGGLIGGGIGAGLGVLGRALGGGRGVQAVQEGVEARRIPTGQLAPTPASARIGRAAGEIAEEVPEQLNIGQRIGRALRGSATGVTPDPTPTGFFNAQQARDKAINVLDSFDQPISSRGVNVSFNRLNKNLDDIIKGSKEVVRGGDIVQDAIGRASLEVDDVARGAAGRVSNVLSDKLNNANTVQELATFKFDLQKQMQPIFKKLAAGNPLSDTEQIRLAFRTAADNALKELVPETAEVLDNMSALHTVSGDILREGAKGFAARPFGLPINVSGTAQRVRSGAGALLEGTGSIPGSGLVRGAREVAGDIAAQPGVQATGDIARRLAIPALARDAVEQPQAAQPTSGVLAPTSPTTLGTFEGREINPVNFALEALQAGLTPEEISQVSSALGIGGVEGDTDLSETQKKDLRSLSTASTVIQDLTQQVEELGLQEGVVSRISGAFRNIAGSVGLDPQAKSFQDIRRSVTSRISRALGEVGTLSDQDREAILSAIPDVSDSATEARNKLDFIQRQLQAAIDATTAF